jgi:hypothetical protein
MTTLRKAWSVEKVHETFFFSDVFGDISIHAPFYVLTFESCLIY